MFTMKGELIKEFTSTAQAHTETNIPTSLINANLNGRSKRVYNWVFSRHKEFPGYDSSKKGSKPIQCFDQAGALLATYDNVMKAHRATGIDWRKIYQQCISVSKDSDLQFYFRYGEKPPNPIDVRHSILTLKAVYQFDRGGQFLAKFESLRAAAAAIGLTRQAIQNVCVGRCPTAGGFQWSYSEQLTLEK